MTRSYASYQTELIKLELAVKRKNRRGLNLNLCGPQVQRANVTSVTFHVYISCPFAFYARAFIIYGTLVLFSLMLLSRRRFTVRAWEESEFLVRWYWLRVPLFLPHIHDWLLLLSAGEVSCKFWEFVDLLRVIYTLFYVQGSYRGTGRRW